MCVNIVTRRPLPTMQRNSARPNRRYGGWQDTERGSSVSSNSQPTITSASTGQPVSTNARSRSNSANSLYQPPSQPLLPAQAAGDTPFDSRKHKTAKERLKALISHLLHRPNDDMIHEAQRHAATINEAVHELNRAGSTVDPETRGSMHALSKVATNRMWARRQSLQRIMYIPYLVTMVIGILMSIGYVNYPLMTLPLISTLVMAAEVIFIFEDGDHHTFLRSTRAALLANALVALYVFVSMLVGVWGCAGGPSRLRTVFFMQATSPDGSIDECPNPWPYYILGFGLLAYVVAIGRGVRICTEGLYFTSIESSLHNICHGEKNVDNTGVNKLISRRESYSG